MMSLTGANLLETVKKQYFFKLKAYVFLFFNMIAVQILGILLSFNGVMSSGTGNGGFFVSVKTFAGNLIIILTMIWAFFVGRSLATDEYRKTDFVFVTNRLSSNLSAAGFALTAAIVGGVTASLSGVLFRIIVYFTYGSQNIADQHFFVKPQELLMSMIATTFYIILISAIGYFFGTLARKHPGFNVLLPAAFVGLLFLRVGNVGNISVVLEGTVNFFIKESSLMLFMIKITGVVFALFYSSILMSNRLEV